MNIIFSLYRSILIAFLLCISLYRAYGIEEVNIGLDKYSQPIEFFDNGKIQGFVADLINWIEHNDTLKFNAIIDENNVLSEKFNNAEIDIITANLLTDELANGDYSIPFIESKLVLIFNNQNKIDNFIKANGSDILIYNKCISQKNAQTLFPNSKIYSINNIEQTFKALETNQFHYIIVNKIHLDHYQKNNKYTTLNFLQIADFTSKYCFKITDDNYQLINKINSSISKFLNSKQNLELRNKWFDNNENGNLLSKIWNYKYIILAIIVICLIFIIIFFKYRFKKNLSIDNNIFESEFETNELVNFIIENSNEYFYAIDRNGTIKYANQYALSKLEYNFSELIDKKINLIDPKFNLEKWISIFEDTKAGKKINLTIAETSKTGKFNHIDFTFSYFCLKEYELIFCYGRDITELINFQHKLEESEKYFKNAFFQNSIPMFIISSDTYSVLDINDSAQNFYGHPKEDYIDKSYFKITGGEAISFNRLLENSNSAIVQSIHKTKNKSDVNVELYISKIKLINSEYILILAFDITEKNNALESLKQSEEKFLKAFKISPYAISINRISDFLFIEANDGFSKTFGYSQIELIGKTKDIINIWQNDDDYKTLIEKLEAKGKITDFFAHLKNKNGSVIEALISAKPIELFGAKCVLSVIIDITEQNKTIEKFNNIEEKYNGLFNAIPDFIFILNQDGIFIDYKSEASKDSKLLIPPSAFIGKSVNEVLPPFLAELTTKKVAELFETGELVEYEYYLEVNGEERKYESRLNICGKSKALAIVRDITNRDKKKSE